MNHMYNYNYKQEEKSPIDENEYVNVSFTLKELPVIHGLPGESFDPEDLKRNDPNYLPSDDSDFNDDEEIQVVDLRPEDLDGEKLTPARSRHSRKDIPKISYKVKRTDSDSDSNSDDDDNKKSRRKSQPEDIADIDLTKPQHFEQKKKDKRYMTPAEQEKERQLRSQKKSEHHHSHHDSSKHESTHSHHESSKHESSHSHRESSKHESHHSRHESSKHESHHSHSQHRHSSRREPPKLSVEISKSDPQKKGKSLTPTASPVTPPSMDQKFHSYNGSK